MIINDLKKMKTDGLVAGTLQRIQINLTVKYVPNVRYMFSRLKALHIARKKF